VNVRLVACDLDGTLIGPGGFGIETAKQVVDYCKKKGCAFTIATGRVFGSVERYLDCLGITGPVITNGGAVVASLGEEPMLQKTIDPKTACSIAFHLRELGLPFYFIAGKEMFTEWTGPETEQYKGYISYDIAVVQCLDDRGIAPTQVVVRVAPEKAHSYVEAFREEFGPSVSVLLSLPHLIEIQAPGVSKASALEALSRELKVAREDVLAIGDSLNDLDMLAWAGHSACVANAHPQVAAVVQQVAERSFAEGVREIVEKAL